MLNSLLEDFRRFVDAIESTEVFLLILVPFVLAVLATILRQSVPNSTMRMIGVIALAGLFHFLATDDAVVLRNMLSIDREFSFNLSVEFTVTFFTFMVFLAWKDSGSILIGILYVGIGFAIIHVLFDGVGRIGLAPIVARSAFNDSVRFEMLIGLMTTSAMIVGTTILRWIFKRIFDDEFTALTIVIASFGMLIFVIASADLRHWLSTSPVALSVVGGALTSVFLCAWVTSDLPIYRVMVIMLLMITSIILYVLVERNQTFTMNIAAEITTSVVAAIMIERSPI